MDTHNQPPKLMDRVKAIMRVKRYSPRTVKTYCYWIRYFIRFNGLRHPASMGGSEVKAFLEYLALQRYVTAATQNQPPMLLFPLSACTGRSFTGVRGLLG
ncbi:phage integrase N-terminal SAM-like domain-containing protein [Chromohalobacter sp.]|uniref:phage integrase N-terminal SAM-like domain-containing protein n=1 Tax=Chromohalobacter sp. TaxID=50740 RepID=UPI003242102D